MTCLISIAATCVVYSFSAIEFEEFLTFAWAEIFDDFVVIELYSSWKIESGILSPLLITWSKTRLCICIEKFCLEVRSPAVSATSGLVSEAATVYPLDWIPFKADAINFFSSPVTEPSFCASSSLL